MQIKLTAALIRRHTETEPPTRDRSFFDTQVPRLALRVKPPRNGGDRWAALYFVRYTSPGGAERRIKVGDPRTMTLDNARVAAKGMLAKVDTGRDPAAESAATREAWQQYQDQASPEFKKKAARSQIEDGAVARLHILRQLRLRQAVRHRRAGRAAPPPGRRRRHAPEQPQAPPRRPGCRAARGACPECPYDVGSG